MWEKVLNQITRFYPRSTEEGARYGLLQTIQHLQNLALSLLIARVIIAIAISYYINIYAAAAYFITMSISAVHEKTALKQTTIEVKNNIIDVKQGENRLFKYVFSRLLVACLFYTAYQLGAGKGNGDSYFAEGIALYIAGLTAISIFQTASSPRLLFYTQAPSLIIILVAAIFAATKNNSIIPLVAPMTYVLSTILMSITTSADRIKTSEIFLENIRQAKDFAEHEKRKQRDSKIRESVERIASVGTYQIYFNGDENIWSHGARRVFGYDENARAPNRTEIIKLVAPEWRHLFVKSFFQCSQSGKTFEIAVQIKDQDGKDKRILINGVPIHGCDGKIIGIDGIVLDETRHYEALSEAKNAEDLLNLALTNGRAAVLEHDFATGKMRGYGALDIFGFNSQTKRGGLQKAVMKTFGRSNTKVIFGAMSTAMRTGEIQNREHKIILDNGKEIHARFAMAVNGNIVQRQGRMITITTDIGEEIRHREELSGALEEAGRATRAKSEFLANMSHEIRTPLNGVIAIAGLLAKSKLDKDQKEMVDMIESSGETLKSLLNDILDLARVESGRLEIENIKFNLKAALKTCVALFGAKAEEKGLDFITSFDEDVDKIYEGDPNRIKQIINNLLSNAIKFTASGKVMLNAYYSRATGNDKICQWVFEIHDSGKGISQKEINNLFRRFEQLDGSITREHGGSGLGLSISKSLAGLMGGSIEVTSTPGEGSVFKLCLPLYECDAEQVETPVQRTNSDNTNDEEMNLSILAADDNATNRKVIEMILSQTGVNLCLCTNGQEALEAYKTGKFDLILMDLQMPVMDGLTATQLIREYEFENGLSRVPLVAVSANAMQHHIQDAINAGADAHLAKPFTPNLLIECIETTLENAQTTPQQDNIIAQ